MSSERVFKVACPTWRHVQIFCDPALRKGRPLTMRLPFEMTVGEVLVVELRLPNELSVDFDSEVVAIRAIGDSRWAAKLRLVGLTEATVSRLGQMMAEEGVVADELAEPVDRLPRPDDLEVPAALQERATALRDTLREIRSGGARAAFDLGPDVTRVAVEEAFAAKMLDVHPDILMSTGCETLVRLGREITIELTASRVAVCASLAGDGSRFAGRSGAYLCHANIDDWYSRSRLGSEAGIASGDEPAAARPTSSSAPAVASPARAGPAAGVEAGAAAVDGPVFAGDQVDEALDDLDAGRIAVARAKLVAAVKADPRNRKVRALYHVAYGRELLERGEAVLATTQFEAALVHDVSCARATRALEALRGEAEAPPSTLWKRLFGG